MKFIAWSKKNDSGQALVEFAFALLLFIPILFFIIDFGWVTFQRSAFEHSYMQSSWAVSASDLGDFDHLDEVPSLAVYSGTTVSDALLSHMRGSSPGLIEGNLSISSAQAELYNEMDSFTVPGRSVGETISAVSRTRYMQLNARVSYAVSPLTYIGKLVFGDTFTVEKEINCTRIVGTQHRSE